MKCLDYSGLQYFWTKLKAYVATSTHSGLMSATDKTRFDSMPMVYTSTADPTSSDGEDGDVWITYTEPTTTSGEEE